MLNIAVCISGGGTDLQSIIDAVEAGEINGTIKLVISNRKKAYGLERARLHGIKAEVIRDEDLIIKRMEEEQIDLIVLAGYLAIVSEKLINRYENRIINIHPSLIPSFCGPGYYGMHVHNEVYKRGVRVSGCTVHFVTADVDGGPIILQKAVDITDVKSPEEIQERVLVEEHKLLPEAVKLFCDGRLKVINERVEIL
ncbi:MAG: phosphoribosylglycinamide formyltransferase [Erysipelotrichaceae bacterium]|nr:phosphoribosylglycinamide formyltransferase [Erysipelotrichaceae bacterium]